jgi:hypothetical protein
LYEQTVKNGGTFVRFGVFLTKRKKIKKTFKKRLTKMGCGDIIVKLSARTAKNTLLVASAQIFDRIFAELTACCEFGP